MSIQVLYSRDEHYMTGCIATTPRKRPGTGIKCAVCFLLCMAASLSISGCSTFNNMTYRGKIIDAETLKPIEGVVVIAQWLECWPGIGAGELCDFEMVRETLTDKNGDWSITGPRGEDTREFGYIRGISSFIIHYTLPPHFYTYKRGYCGRGHSLGAFEAFPFISEDKGIEGIILIKPGDTREETHKFFEKYGGLFWPFIPMKNSRQRLEALDFDFRYPEKIEVIESESRKFNDDYIVYGLARAKTSKDFMDASSLTLHWKADYKLKILPSILDRDSTEDFKGYDD